MKGDMCENCRFWERNEDLKGYGYCHRFPPTWKMTAQTAGALSVTESTDAWTETQDHEWCGEYDAEDE